MKYAIISACLFIFAVSCATSGFGVYHTVRKNETVKSVSELYKIDAAVLKSENQIPDDIITLDEGMTLFIPGVKEVLAPIEPVVTAEVPAETQKVVIEPEKTETAIEMQLSFKWPLLGTVTGHFGGEFENRNEGIDIEIAEGTEVRAAADGKVIYSAGHHGFGNMVIIQHNDRFVSIYAHLQAITAKEGQTILTGELIGFSGKTGSAATPRLHFEIREFSKPVDPEKYLPDPHPALLPEKEKE
ncbi:MAG TPA: LysM peptidoglycan-binding domain-containing M23 family metallopeptidase [bacterium]|nr:LysM peptidoglycan-binding domain-containing M23 family metallopeptidase [bacterium]HPS28893.1 LysM peptidoglycan-binding domain-containing M23 family metallopeptidase [bacterium]